jgi:nitrogen regulatory protein PII
MQTYPKKRIDIVVEAPVVGRVLAKLDELGVNGYTVLPAVAGRGAEGQWTREGMVGEAGRMMLIFSIIDAARVDPILDAVFKLVERQIGIVTVSDVQVVRPDHF